MINSFFWTTLLLILHLLVNPWSKLIAQNNSVGIPFQAIAKDRFNNPIKSQLIYIQSNLLFARDSQLVYSEEFESLTDEYGLFQITIGSGKYIGGLERELLKISFSKMNLILQLKIAVPPNSVITNWVYTDHWIELGSAPFGFVPYAIYALQSPGGLSIKSKGRSNLLLAVDSLVINLNDTFDLDDGISISLESDKLPLATPSYYIQRDLAKNRLLIYFTAPYSGFLTWMIID